MLTENVIVRTNIEDAEDELARYMEAKEKAEQQLGALAGIDGFTRKPGKSRLEAFGSEMLVLSGINSQILDKFLAECGRKNVGKIALRAVLTPQNIFWTPEQLHKELQKEYLFHAGI